MTGGPSDLGLVERSTDANSTYVLFGLKSLGYLVFRTGRSFSVESIGEAMVVIAEAIEVAAEAIEVAAEVFELVEVSEAFELEVTEAVELEVVNARLVVAW